MDWKEMVYGVICWSIEVWSEKGKGKNTGCYIDVNPLVFIH